MTDDSGYLAVTIGGVQEFIAASRRTADLWAGSRIMSRLCQVAVEAVRRAGGTPVIPESAAIASALPNRVFAIVPAGSVRDVGTAACAAARAEWLTLAGITHRPPSPMAADLDTFPTLRWVGWEPPSGGPIATGQAASSGPAVLPGQVSGYEWAWRAVSAAADARKRVRDFSAYTGRAPDICSLCGRRDGHAVLRRLRIADGERLCAVCAVKRDPRVIRQVTKARSGFPSTGSLATAPFRLSILTGLADQGMDGPLGEAVREHRAAVRAIAAWLAGRSGADDTDDREIPGVLPALEDVAALVDDPAGEAVGWSRMDGTWCFPETWQPAPLAHERGLGDLTDGDRDELNRACRRGRAAATALAGALAGPPGPSGLAGPTGPARYLAMVLLDGDDMGTALAEPDPGILAGHRSMRAWHGAVSRTLTGLAAQMSAVFDGAFGRAVYAGGDDLFGLIPAACALPVAAGCREAFGQRLAGVLGRPTASGAVVFFHHSFPLQEALRRAREALEEAKAPTEGKDRLSVVVLRRGGERARAVLPWAARGASSVHALTGLARWFDGPLSARLLADLHRERRGLAELARDGRRHSSEVTRLVNRHRGPGGPAEPPAVLALGDLPTVGEVPEPAALVDHLQPAHVTEPEQVARWVETLEIAHFLAQEGR